MSCFCVNKDKQSTDLPFDALTAKSISLDPHKPSHCFLSNSTNLVSCGLIAGYLYDIEATSVPGGGNTCTGAHCFMLVYLIMVFSCVLGCGLELLLVFRTNNVYSKIHIETQFQH